MNWYRVTRPHDAFAQGDLVLLPGSEREAWLERNGFLKFFSVDGGTAPAPSIPTPEFKGLEPATKDEAFAPKSATVKRKRVGRGESAEARPAEGEPVEPVSGDEPRGQDVPPHRA